MENEGKPTGYRKVLHAVLGHRANGKIYER
jgi:hypothetical protein